MRAIFHKGKDCWKVITKLFPPKKNFKFVNFRGFAFHFARPPIPSRARRGEEIRFEQFQVYTAISLASCPAK